MEVGFSFYGNISAQRQEELMNSDCNNQTHLTEEKKGATPHTFEAENKN